LTGSGKTKYSRKQQEISLVPGNPRLPRFLSGDFSHPQDSKEQIGRLLSALFENTGKENPGSIEGQLSRLIFHPQDLLACGQLSPDHSLYRGFIIIQDAWEAATNGMENPEVFDLFEKLPSRPLFLPWIKAVEGIRFFYQNRSNMALDCWSQIPPDHPLARLAELGKGLNPEPSLSLSPRATDFLQKIREPNPLLVDSLEQLYDATEAGLEGIFFISLETAVKTMQKDSPSGAQALALWAIDPIWSEEWDEQKFLQILARLFGDREGLRLLAIGLVPIDPEAAYLLWLQYILQSLRGRFWTKTQGIGAVQIARRIFAGLEDFWGDHHKDQNFEEQRENLRTQIKLEWELHRFGEIPESLTTLPAKEPQPERVKKNQDLQLDLFS
jgi:hypothetical protein